MNTDPRVRSGVLPDLLFLAVYQRSSVFISGLFSTCFSDWLSAVLFTVNTVICPGRAGYSGVPKKVWTKKGCFL